MGRNEMNLDDLKKLAEGENLRYFVDPNRPTLMMGFGGFNGRYQVVVPLELDGRFLQFRTIGYHSCPQDHAHLEAVLRLLATLDYQLRLTKFGWDPSDGEIVAYADVWLEDGKITQKQFSEMVHCYVSAIDFNNTRIGRTIDTGTDPGELKPEDILAGASGLPPDLRETLERLSGKKKDEDPEGPQEI
jgi:hypothetical protein